MRQTKIRDIEERVNMLNRLTGKKHYPVIEHNSSYRIKEQVKDINEMTYVEERGVKANIRLNIMNNPTILESDSENGIIQELDRLISELK